MTLLSGKDLQDAIAHVTSGKKISCAVAFWGVGAEQLIKPCDSRKVRIVCNLKTGGTNPRVIEGLIDAGAQIRQNDRLHAKVYIGDDFAILTSANASINGLGLEGSEATAWMEAGTKISRTEAQSWFEDLWKESRKISSEDLKAAYDLFRSRSVLKPARGTFANFYPTQDDFPFLSWERRTDWDYKDDAIKTALGYVSDDVHHQIDYGLDVEDSADIETLCRGRWVLFWPTSQSGKVRQKGEFWWTCSSGVHVPNSFQYVGDEPQGAILAMFPMPEHPFDVAERRFKQAFRTLMNSDNYCALREMTYEGTFYTENRRAWMWNFWNELKDVYSRVEM